MAADGSKNWWICGTRKFGTKRQRVKMVKWLKGWPDPHRKDVIH